MFALKKSAVVAAAVAAAFVFLAGAGLSAVSVSRNVPAAPFCVVLDAGHGGVDPGVRGLHTDVKESDLNLDIVKRLAVYFENAGFSVVLTRENEGGLYGAATSGYKKRDMQARKEIIDRASPNAVLSVHLNSFPAAPSRRGGQVFFKENDEAGQALAQSIQAQFNSLNGTSFSALRGEYYMLNCTDRASVIVECGFLSNAEDERLLCTEEYREQVAYAIFLGTIAYFG